MRNSCNVGRLQRGTAGCSVKRRRRIGCNQIVEGRLMSNRCNGGYGLQRDIWHRSSCTQANNSQLIIYTKEFEKVLTLQVVVSQF
jgi:hypothetical protein